MTRRARKARQVPDSDSENSPIPSHYDLVEAKNDHSSDREDNVGDAQAIGERLNRIERTIHTTMNISTADEDPEFRGGAIESVELHNFMCHEHLKVDLRGSINFIVGNNGSGKSAILTALTICLGARASSTQRAASVESLIKEGASEARVIVTVSNRGSFPFRADVYGGSVIVERRIRRAGLNSYRTRSGDGKRIISERKEEIVALCDHYNIQVENPLAVLSQETAKKFLANATPADLYDFFMKGTNLEQMSYDFSYAQDRMDSMEKSLSMTKSFWPQKEAQIEELQDQLTALEHVRDHQQSIAKLKSEIAWTKVASSEKTLEEHKRELEGAHKKLHQAQKGTKHAEVEIEQIRAKILEAESAYTQTINQKVPLQSRLTELKAQIAAKNAQLRECDARRKEINETVKADRETKEELEAKIAAEEAKEDDQHARQVRAQLSDLEDTLVSLNRELSQTANQRKELEESIAELMAQLTRAQVAVDEISSELRRDEGYLATAQAAFANRLRAYGPTLPEAIAEIDAEASQFTQKPIGPIGMYVNLRDQQWSLPMAAIIGSNLASFVCTSHPDRIRLQAILNRHRCRNHVIVISPTALDMSSGLPDSQYQTALDILQVNHPLVLKALVIMTGLERIVLMKNRAAAMHLIGNERPRNVDCAYTLTHRITATRNATLSMALYDSPHGNPFESSQERIKHLSAQIAAKTAQLQSHERATQEFSRAISERSHQVDQLKTTFGALQTKISNTKGEIRELESQLGGSDKFAISTYRDEALNIQRRIELLTSQFQDNWNLIRQFSQDLAELDAQLQETLNELESLGQHGIQIQDEIIELNDRKRELERIIAAAALNIRNAQSSVDELQAVVEASHAQLEDLLEEAQDSGYERIRARRTIGAIEDEILKLQEFIHQNTSLTLNYDQVQEDLRHAQQELARSLEYYEINHKLWLSFKAALQRRRNDWEQFRDQIAHASNESFVNSLELRGFRGNLEYDHEARHLYINVQVDNFDGENGRDEYFEAAGSTGKRRDIKQLSGGEKSFGTTCFLLSLWQAMGCPFRCLDEFDVFMDAVNRQHVIEMLIHAAHQIKNQFILITPVSVRGYLSEEDRDHVHMVMMRNPVRQ